MNYVKLSFLSAFSIVMEVLGYVKRCNPLQNVGATTDLFIKFDGKSLMADRGRVTNTIEYNLSKACR